jgi:hypothetical protein
MTGKTRRYTLSEMKARSTGHFFDHDTMKFFSGDKYGTRYDRETGQNYIRVTHPSGQVGWHKFDPQTGRIHPVSTQNVPVYVREK